MPVLARERGERDRERGGGRDIGRKGKIKKEKRGREADGGEKWRQENDKREANEREEERERKERVID